MTDPELTWPSFKFAIWEAGPLPQEQNPIQIEGFAGGKGDPQFGYGRNPAMANPSWDPGIGPREVEHVRQSGNAKARGRDRPGRGRSGLRRAAPGADRQRHPARDREIPCLHRRGRIVGGGPARNLPPEPRAVGDHRSGRRVGRVPVRLQGCVRRRRRGGAAAHRRLRDRGLSLHGRAAVRDPSGFVLLPGRLDAGAQAELVAEVLAAAEQAPFHRQVTPGGKPMSVEMTGLGQLSWGTDARGNRYEPAPPLTGKPWPAIPRILLDLWAELADAAIPPDSCLVNRYGETAKMGLHRDEDEADYGFPVLSVSLGDTAIFRLGGLKRTDPTRSLRLTSGDVCLLAGQARLAYHGIDRILPGSSRVVPGGGRLNLTLRRAAPAPALAAGTTAD